LQLTASSLRSCLAPASGSSWRWALAAFPSHHSRKPQASSTMSHNSFSLPVTQEDSH